jgi:hypothetical protein
MLQFGGYCANSTGYLEILTAYLPVQLQKWKIPEHSIVLHESSTAGAAFEVCSISRLRFVFHCKSLWRTNFSSLTSSEHTLQLLSISHYPVHRLNQIHGAVCCPFVPDERNESTLAFFFFHCSAISRFRKRKI